MAGRLPELFRTSAREIIGQYLPTMIGRPIAVLSDDDHWRRTVVDPAWKKLPLPCRLLGRGRLGWDRLFDELRKAAYETRGTTIQFRPDVQTRTAFVFKEAVQAVSTFMEQSPPETMEVAPATIAASMPSTVFSPRESTTSSTTARPDAVMPITAGPAIGIDLGTTYSAVAYLDAHGRPVCLPNAAGDLTTPSVVLFDEDGTVVGEEAARAAPLEPDRVATCVKRDMGGQRYHRAINGEHLPPEVISSVILRALRADAERRLGPVTKAVITVPAYFDEPRRKSTMDAGRMAGLEVLDIINEPTAAALAYGDQLGFLDPVQGTPADETLRVFVYDLGGGTFDVTILEIQGTSFRTVATDGDVQLGGKDWDEKIVEMAAEAFQKEFGDDPRDDPATLQEMWLAAETVKKTLTERLRASMYVNSLGRRLKLDITREEFERATAALAKLTRRTSEIVLRNAGLTWQQIDRVLLVGGSTRMPMIVRMMEEATGRPADRSLSPDEAVAHGAALYADLLLRQQGHAGQSQATFTLTNVNSHALGIAGLDRTGKRVNHIIIPKNTQLPCSVEQVFHTARANQSNVKVEVLEGENPHPEYCTLVGVSTVRDLPPQLEAGWPVRVAYHYEENGRLHVTARIEGAAQGVTTTFLRDHNLPEDDLLAWSEYVAGGARRES